MFPFAQDRHWPAQEIYTESEFTQPRISNSVLLTVLVPAGLAGLIEFRFGNPFVHESFIVTPPLIVLILARGGCRFATN